MIFFTIPSLPISVNALYMTIRKGKKVLRVITKEGRAWKKETTAHLAQNYVTELASLKPDVPYLIVVKLYFKNLQNKGWPEKAKTRYKRLDGTNRIKVLEDVIADVSGIDDSHNLTFIVVKCEGGREMTDVWMWNLQDEESPFDEILHDLPTVQPHRALPALS